jgi:hypothetical protein
MTHAGLICYINILLELRAVFEPAQFSRYVVDLFIFGGAQHDDLGFFFISKFQGQSQGNFG